MVEKRAEWEMQRLDAIKAKEDASYEFMRRHNEQA